MLRFDEQQEFEAWLRRCPLPSKALAYAVSRTGDDSCLTVECRWRLPGSPATANDGEPQTEAQLVQGILQPATRLAAELPAVVRGGSGTCGEGAGLAAEGTGSGAGGGGTGGGTGGGAGGGACSGAGSSRQPAEAAEKDSADSEEGAGMESEGSDAEGEAGGEGGRRQNEYDVRGYDECYKCGVRGHWSVDCRAPRVYLHCPFGQKDEAKARQ